MACFADINVLQGSVATYARSGGIFDIRLTANLRRNLPVKKCFKPDTNWQNYGHESVAPVFGPSCILPLSVDTLRRLEVDKVRFGSEHDLLEDDSEAVDVSFLSSVDRSSRHSQQFGRRPQLMAVTLKVAHLRK